MSSAVEGGDLITLIEVDQDQCSRVYGVGACTASLSAENPHKCFNTRKTCQDPDNYDRATLTLTFCEPIEIDTGIYTFPLLKGVSTSPSRLNTTSRVRNEPLGIRSSCTASFTDAPHTDRYVDKYAEERLSGSAQFSGVGYDPLERGQFWGKWRARNPYWLGRSMRVRQGVIERGQFSQLTQRHYIIESFSGPDNSGNVSIVGKDVLKLADNDRAQCPRASTGELLADITDIETAATLSPGGIGNLKYPVSGKITIGSELMDFTRDFPANPDNLTLVRAANNTEASAHDAGDTVQLSVVVDGETIDTIVADLLTTYAEVDSGFIISADWAAEVALYLPSGYSAVIPKPTSVRNLIGELAEQAGFSLWWDEIAQTIRLSAVKQPSVASLTITDDWMLDGSLRIKDRPDARLSQVWTYYGILNPTASLDNPNNYRATLVTIDPDAESGDEYGQDAVRKINSRWITVSGKAAAISLNDRLLSRFRDIIRETKFKLPSYRADQIKMGATHQISSRFIIDKVGDPQLMPIRVLSVEQDGDTLSIDAEELIFKRDPNATTQPVIVGGSLNSINFRELYDQEYPLGPSAVNDIVLIIETGVVVGANTAMRSLDVGDWADYTYNSLTIIHYGLMIGIGGFAGFGGTSSISPSDGTAGGVGGTALYTRVPITLKIESIGIKGGGGGGGGGGSGSSNTADFGGDGGRGAGEVGNQPNPVNVFGAPENGGDGTLTAGGAGEASAGVGGDGGNGGAPDQDGQDGFDSGIRVGGAKGLAGIAIDGVSFITVDPTGAFTDINDIVGSKVN
jgi:hypothetical protein